MPLQQIAVICGQTPCRAVSTHYLCVHPVITLICVLLLQGTRFAILHGDGPKPNLSVYEMKDVRSAVKAVQPVVHNPSRRQRHPLVAHRQEHGPGRPEGERNMGNTVLLKVCAL